MTDVWLAQDAHYRVLAENPRDAATALREVLLKRQEIGKFTSVTVVLEAATSEGRNIYREVM